MGFGVDCWNMGFVKFVPLQRQWWSIARVMGCCLVIWLTTFFVFRCLLVLFFDFEDFSFRAKQRVLYIIRSIMETGVTKQLPGVKTTHHAPSAISLYFPSFVGNIWLSALNIDFPLEARPHIKTEL